VEGGAKLLQLFIATGLWDEARIFTAPHKLRQGVTSPRLHRTAQREEHIGNDLLQIMING
jgi:diaminohydroxyphosphoribosylaminopyrimidine deaminase/5-amino-6-(5-phosphoribosylamino)uracil reductase